MSVDLPSQFERLSVQAGGRSLDASLNNNKSLSHDQQAFQQPLQPSQLGLAQYGSPVGSQQMRKQRSQRFSVPLNSAGANHHQHQQPNASLSSVGSLAYQSHPPGLSYDYPSSSGAYNDGMAASMERSLSQESNPYSQASFEDPTPAHYAAPSISGFNFASPHSTVPPPSRQAQQPQNHVNFSHNQYASPYGGIDQQQQSQYGGAGGYSATGGGQSSRAMTGSSQMEQSSSRGAERKDLLSSEWVRGQQQQHHGQPGFMPMAPAFGSLPQDDEVIPTAIVIKNIPFAAPKEHLLGVMEDLRLPPPFAFNYHYDQGQFRGLAFANFRQAQDAALAVSALNGFDLQGRKLRAEFKKVLKEGEKERIERDKAIRRMRSTQQLVNSNDYLSGSAGGWPGAGRAHQFSAGSGHDEEDYGKPVQGSFGGQPATAYHARNANMSTFGARQFVPAPPLSDGQYSAPSSAANGYSASPPSDVGTSVSARMAKQASTSGSELSATDSARGRTTLDLNDPQSLEIFSRVLLFKDDSLRDELSFARSLTASQRRIVHLVARKLGLEHQSVGVGDDRHVVVFKSGAGLTPTQSSGGLTPEPAYHRTLRHSASTLGRQLSRDGPAGSFLSPADPSGNLRGKKSMPDIRASLFAGPQGYPGPPSFYAPPPLPPLGNEFASGSDNIHLGEAQSLSQQPHNHPNARRSNVNLRDSYTTAVNGLRQQPHSSGLFQQQQQQQHAIYDTHPSRLGSLPTSMSVPSLGVPLAMTQQQLVGVGATPHSSDGGSSSSPNLSLLGLNGGPPTESSHTSVSEEGQQAHKNVGGGGGGGGGASLIMRQPVGPPANVVDGGPTSASGDSHQRFSVVTNVTSGSNEFQTTTRTDLIE
ncbi:hypothetical protein ACM66B_006509 [Microbotryomycetes sp. NB124-2]